MKINTKIRYAIRTLIEIAGHDNREGMLQKEIAQRQNLSEKYLDHIISGLKAAQLVQNIKGKRSGYMLTKDPEKIRMYEIIHAFEDDLLKMQCFYDDENCSRQDTCASRDFWLDLNSHIDDYLKKITLASLISKQNELTQSSDENYL